MIRRLSLLLLVAGLLGGASLETPEQFAGFRVGADKKLVRWDRLVEYMQKAAAASPRVKFEEYGKTTNRNPFIVVTISSPETMGDLPRCRENQRRLAYPYNLTEPEAHQLINQQKAVLLITCNIHSTEIASTQMALELVHRLATEDSPFIRHILDNVIFLLVPSLNPDGQILVTDWYNKNVGTPYEYSPLPELYHKYTGHDNNRDAFMNTQVESRLINRLTYKEWFPVVFLDEHQMGSSGPRLFVPPFKDPINPNVDPLVWELNGLLGFAMGTAVNQKGYPGVISDAMFTSWWQGGFLMQAWWHNMVGLLTEMASVNVASPIDQEMAKLGDAPRGPELTYEQMRDRDPRKPLPPPRDVTPRNNYPRPWLGGKWTLRNIVDYELEVTYGLLEAVAGNRVLLNRSFYTMNRKQIELGSKEAPFAYLVPPTQNDPPVAARMLQILDELGVEVDRAQAPFEAGGKKYPSGTHVVLMTQPFRAFAKDLLEKQTYPVQRVSPGGPIERPYDVTGWTLPYQMGVDTVEVPKKFDATLERISPVPAASGQFESPSGQKIAGYFISHAQNNSAIAVNRLLARGVKVAWDPGGAIFVPHSAATARDLEGWSRQLGIRVKAAASAPTGQIRSLAKPRIALYRPWMPSMDEGWTRWVLEQYEFPYSVLRDADVKAGKLIANYDAILIARQSKDSLLKGATEDWIRPEHRGALGSDGVAALKEFVRGGGTLITLGSASLLPAEEFPLPLKSSLKGLRGEQFSCPGSILRVFVDNTSPVGYGMPDEVPAVFYNDLAFDLAAPLGEQSVRVIAKYPSGSLLKSGWIGGPEYLEDRVAAAEVTMGKGRVIVLGFSAVNRAQPHATFKLLFNSLHYAAAKPLLIPAKK